MATARAALEDAAWTGSGWAVDVLQQAELVVAYGVRRPTFVFYFASILVFSTLEFVSSQNPSLEARSAWSSGRARLFSNIPGKQFGELWTVHDIFRIA